MDVLVMENLLFGRNLTRLYNLNGSSRSRYNPDSSGSNKVLLDQNITEAMPTSPIFVGNKAKRLLERAVWTDTAFLAAVFMGQALGDMGEGFCHTWWAQECISNSNLTQTIQEEVQESDDYITDGPRSVVTSNYHTK